MAYSKSPAVLRKIEHQLEQLSTGRIVTWEFDDPAEADRWAYKVRQGFSIAKRNPHLFPMVERAARSYEIQVIDSLVRAIPKPEASQPQREVAALTTGYKRSAESHLQNMPMPERPKPAGHVIVNPSLSEFISFWISKQPTLEDFIIERCMFTNDELAKLGEWAAAMEPPLYVSHVTGSQRVVVGVRPPEQES